MDAVIALSRLGGVATHAELVGEVGRPALRRALRAGMITRRHRDSYALDGADAAHLAAVQAHGARALLSAAAHHGWKVKEPPKRPQIMVRRGSNRSALAPIAAEVRYAALSDAELADRVTAPVRTVIDCARFLPFDAALAVADSALRCGDVGPRELLDAAERAPRTGRANAVRIAQHATAEAANPMESVLRAICIDVPGLDVQPQVWATESERVDLADTDRRLIIEAESFEFHGQLEGYRRDVRRYTRFVRLGYQVLRFCWEDIMLRPSYVADVITDVLHGRAPEPAVRRSSGEAAA